MMSKSIFIFFMTIVLACEIEGYCYTAWGARGNCVNIKKCNPLMRLLKTRPILSPVLRILRKSQCGFEGFDPKVCCQSNDESPDFDSKPPNNQQRQTNQQIKQTPKTNQNRETIQPKPIKSLPYESQHDFKMTTTMMRPTTTRTTTTTRATTTRTTTTTTTRRRMTTTYKTPVPLVPIYDHPNLRLLDDEQCGPISEGRIYGGNLTSIYEFPWMAVLGYDIGEESNEFRCGGSLISKRYVLTAAHCTTDLPDDMKLETVRLGEYDLSRDIDCDSWEDGAGFNCAPKYQDFGIERVHVHPDFARRKLVNDISLIRLSRPADLEPPSVRPICLPLGQAALLKPNKALVTGWGSTERGLRSQRLLKVAVPIVDIETCNKVYKYQMIKLWDKQICAGGITGKDSCSGDSGGPLQALGIYKGRQRSIVYGIVSFGAHSCGVEGYPGVYTNVAHYVGWILDSITE